MLIIFNLQFFKLHNLGESIVNSCNSWTFKTILLKF